MKWWEIIFSHGGGVFSHLWHGQWQWQRQHGDSDKSKAILQAHCRDTSPSVPAVIGHHSKATSGKDRCIPFTSKQDGTSFNPGNLNLTWYQGTLSLSGTASVIWQWTSTKLNSYKDIEDHIHLILSLVMQWTSSALIRTYKKTISYSSSFSKGACQRRGHIFGLNTVLCTCALQCAKKRRKHDGLVQWLAHRTLNPMTQFESGCCPPFFCLYPQARYFSETVLLGWSEFPCQGLQDYCWLPLKPDC